MKIKKTGIVSSDRLQQLWYICDDDRLVIAEFYFPANRTAELESFVAPKQDEFQVLVIQLLSTLLTVALTKGDVTNKMEDLLQVLTENVGEWLVENADNE